MNEELQILYMQARLVRLASEKWNKPFYEVNDIFKEKNVYHYIAELWGIFHVEGDEAVFDDIEEYLRAKGTKI